MLRFDLQTKKWTTLCPMNTARASFTAVVSSNCSSIFVMGGSNNSEREGLALLERYDVVGNYWENLAPMNQRRFMHAAAIVNM